MAETRQPALPGVHSLDHFDFTVPDLQVAEHFYRQFGLDVRGGRSALELYATGHPHKWITVRQGTRKALGHITFGAFASDFDRFRDHLAGTGVELSESEEELRFRDPHGVSLGIRVAEKSAPDIKTPENRPQKFVRAAPLRENAPAVRPRRMSHALFFTPDIETSVRFYCDALGLRISDYPGPVAFLHGIHGSDHHLIAFAQSRAVGVHHSSWDVSSIEEVGLGAAQMASAGFTKGWGVGRHVLGSNYFFYVEDPWGSFAEYSFDIDFIPAGLNWEPGYPAPENSLYLWGPPPPDNFVENTEAL